jgi:Acetyltransferase (GNAT) domain
LRRLTVNDVVKDFDAINARVAPDGRFEPWLDTTLEQNLVDLGWHQKEFQLRRSFAYTVVRPDESQVVGCFYLYPSDEADAEARLWVRREAWDEGLDPPLEEALREWIAERWPFERVTWPERER